MKLYAISDIHISYPENRDALANIPEHPNDWLIVAGDIGEEDVHFHCAFGILVQKFAKVIWTPGNHDLWSSPLTNGYQGEEKYFHLLEIAHCYGVVTPEDQYLVWPGEGENCWIAPVFLLYDYSFRPTDVSLENAVSWAYKSGLLCKDEYFLKCTPYKNIVDWCARRCELTYQRIRQLPWNRKIIFVSHYPLISRPVQRLQKIPRFSIWCGTTRTQTWHIEFPTYAVVYGHLHIRASDSYDGVRFEEVSLGYPKHWDITKNVAYYLREILPGNTEIANDVIYFRDRT